MQASMAMLPLILAGAAALDPRVEPLIANMSLAEKAGQLGVFSRPAGSDFNPGTGGGWNETLDLLRNGSIGALYNGAGVAINAELQRVAVEESRLGIPLIFGADVWHGMWTVFPMPLGEAASWEPALAESTARATAVEATASGIFWTYSPMVDVARDQRWGRVAEGAGEDPFLGAAFARARVTGFQGNGSLAANDSMIACLKHYAGYGGVAAGLDYSAVDVSEATFRDVFLPPFIAGVEAGALTLMSAFVAIVGGIPASGSRWLQTEVLRQELGFTGFVVSDYEADLELIDHGYASNESDAAFKALWAGVDMSMQSGLYREYLPGLAKEGILSMDTLDEAVRRVLDSKARMGLFDDPYRSLDPTREASAHYSVAHDELALTAARKSVVMLRNVDSLLPLKKVGQKIALIGWWANDNQNAQGCGVVWGNSSFVVTLHDGIASAMKDPQNELKTVEGSLVEAPTPRGIADATAAAQWADVVVLALGEPTNYSGEAQSRTDIIIPHAQQALAEAVSAVGKPTVVLLKNGRALALEGAVKNAQAIMVTWFLGKKSGEAIADLLFGDHSPEGRLPVSFPVRSGQQPYLLQSMYHYNHASSGRPCVGDSPPSNQGRAFKNCWREIANSALYPFGYGLTYSSFTYGKPVFSNGGMMAWDGMIEITTKLTNTGAREATEVVQLYVHDVVASRVRPVRELKGFKKVSLAAGASAEVRFTLDRAAVSFAAVARGSVDASGPGTTVEPGTFDVWVAPSATAGGDATQFELLPPK